MTWKLSTLSPLALAAALAGCAMPDTTPPAVGHDSSRNPELLQPDLYPNGAVSEPQVRYGRYTLVNTAPETEQRDLMAQIIDVSIPGSMKPSVRDAMQYVVNRSGYSLCGPEQGHVNILFTRPLPAAQYKLGPMSLRSTLQVLAGPAWQVKVDEVMRSVCFVLRPGYQLPESPRLATVPPVSPVVSSPSVRPATLAAIASGSQPSAAPDSKPLQIQTDTKTAPAVAAGALHREASVTAPKPTSGAVTPALSATEHHRATPAKDGTSSVTRPVAGTVVSPPVQAVDTRPGTPSSTPAGQTAAAPHAAATKVATAKPYALPSVRLTEPASALGQTWEAQVGSTLRRSVEAWAQRAGWQLVWDAPDLDYPIEARLQFKGTFAEAIAQIFPLYDGAPRAFVVDGNTSQRIVHVSERKNP